MTGTDQVILNSISPPSAHPDGSLFQGFVTDSADKIFQSTDRQQHHFSKELNDG